MDNEQANDQTTARRAPSSVLSRYTASLALVLVILIVLLPQRPVRQAEGERGVSRGAPR